MIAIGYVIGSAHRDLAVPYCPHERQRETGGGGSTAAVARRRSHSWRKGGRERVKGGQLLSPRPPSCIRSLPLATSCHAHLSTGVRRRPVGRAAVLPLPPALQRRRSGDGSLAPGAGATLAPSDSPAFARLRRVRPALDHLSVGLGGSGYELPTRTSSPLHAPSRHDASRRLRDLLAPVSSPRYPTAIRSELRTVTTHARSRLSSWIEFLVHCQRAEAISRRRSVPSPRTIHSSLAPSPLPPVA